MVVPTEVDCPICKNKMMNINKENPVLSVNTLSLIIDGQKKISKTEIFMCKNCNNIQSFMVLTDATSN
ncbi:MAG: hypothetical protein ACR2LL_11540 [Nitrosopumilus sp.]